MTLSDWNYLLAFHFCFLDCLTLLNDIFINILYKLWLTTCIWLSLLITLRSTIPSRLVLAGIVASCSLEHVSKVFRKTTILSHTIHEVNRAKESKRRYYQVQSCPSQVLNVSEG